MVYENISDDFAHGVHQGQGFNVSWSYKSQNNEVAVVTNYFSKEYSINAFANKLSNNGFFTFPESTSDNVILKKSGENEMIYTPFFEGNEGVDQAMMMSDLR